jgi:predicted phosphoadenosine phosphosulfate sulfurtransferase
VSLTHHVIDACSRIRRLLDRVERPALMCSFGKDSLVLVDLLARFKVRDVMYLENIDEIVDETYNAALVARYDLRVRWLPRGRGVLFFVRGAAQFFCYPFLSTQTMLPVPMALTPWEGDGEYLCVDDELRAIHGTVSPLTFDGLFFGQKRCDLLDGGGACLPWFPMLSAETQANYHARMTPAGPFWALNEMQACSPLYDWSQDDVWEYIEAHKLPTSAKVYDGRTRRLHEHRACYRCHDPSLPAKVMCPKIRHAITNLGALAPIGPERLIQLGLLTAEESKELTHA